jgi:hypothetical protein
MYGHILLKLFNIKFHENPFRGSSVITYRDIDIRTDRNGEANFATFNCRCTKK